VRRGWNGAGALIGVVERVWNASEGRSGVSIFEGVTGSTTAGSEGSAIGVVEIGAKVVTGEGGAGSRFGEEARSMAVGCCSGVADRS
jgi:hypothetical protein